jgi:hypothetical protein
MSEYISWLGAAVAILSAFFSASRARSALRSLRQSRVNRLFDSFDLSSQLAFSRPEVAYAVHGIDPSISPEEIRNLVYLSVLLDGYKAYWSDQFKGRFEKGSQELQESSTYLNHLLRVPGNRKRWEILKPIGYGEMDREFVRAIDDLIRYEQLKS